MTDADHWLWRLSAREWLEAGERELELARAQLGARRTAITHARRAAGMALNGALVAMAAQGWSRERCETAWGRSYIDHLRTLAAPAPEPRHPFGPDLSEACRQACRQACRSLLAIPVMPNTDLVRLVARKDAAAAEAIEHAAAITSTCAAVIGS
jgi:hypothetical protein